MSINTVLTQILTSLEYGLQRRFMRRTGVRVSMCWNFIIHQIFSEFLQPLRDFRTQRVSLFLLGFLFLLVLGILLAWISSGCPDPSSTKIDTGTGEMSLIYLWLLFMGFGDFSGLVHKGLPRSFINRS